MFPPTHLLVKTCGGSFPVQKKLVMNEQHMSEHTHMPWMYNKLHFCLCNVYLDLKQRIRSSWKLCCFVAGLTAGSIHRQQAGMLPGGWDAEITRMARKRRDGHKVSCVLRQTWGRGRGGGIGLMAVRRRGKIMRRGWNRRGPTKGQKPRIQAVICVIPPWLDRDYLIGDRSCLSDWLRLFWTEGVWAAKEFFGFRFSNSSDSLLAPVASLSPMLVFTSALLLPFLLFSSFDTFKFLLLPDAVVSLFRNVFVPSLLLNDVPVCPSSSEPGSFGETCGRIPRNQVGCLKKIWTADPW